MNAEDQNSLLYAMEAEEEALVNSLSRKLEQLRAEKVVLESTLEMEQEQLVNRLQRQLSQLLTTQQQDTLPSASSVPSSPTTQDLPLDAHSHLGSRSLPRTRFASSSTSPGGDTPNFASLLSTSDPTNPSCSTIVEALQSENDTLRNRLADAESSVDRASRMSEMYRLELLALRRDAGLDVADLMATTPASLVPDDLGINARSRQSMNSGGGAGGRGIRIPGVSNSPPYSAQARSSVLSKSSSSYSPSTPFSLSSSMSTTSPSSSGRMTSATTPSVSYTTPQVPASTPVNSSMQVPPAVIQLSTIPSSPTEAEGSRAESLQRRLSNSRNGARVAETGTLRDRSR